MGFGSAPFEFEDAEFDGGEVVEEEEEEVAEGFAASGTPSPDALSASSGTDLRARESTSTVSSRSLANRVIAKSFVCSFSRAALRWRLRKSACR